VCHGRQNDRRANITNLDTFNNCLALPESSGQKVKNKLNNLQK
jgi:hypothetical protein